MENKSKILIAKILFLFVAIIHILIVWFYTPKFSLSDTFEQKMIFFSTKIISFILIIVFWQLFPVFYNAFKNKDEQKMSFLKYTLGYFLINSVILYLTYPLYHMQENVITGFQGLFSHQVDWFPNFFAFMNIHIGYNIIPSVKYSTLVYIFIYSLIFAYCITQLKNKIQSKLYLLLFFPFCVPFVLFINLIQLRIIFAGYILLFSFVYIYFNQKKEEAKYSVALIFAVICSTTAGIRSEFMPLILFFPLLVFSLKVFTKKALIVYVIVFLTLFSGFYYIQKKNNGLHYEAFVAAYIYDDYITNKFYDKDVEKNTAQLRKIYKASFDNNVLPGYICQYDVDNKKEAKKAILSLAKFGIKKSPHFIVKNLKSVLGNDYDNFQIHRYFNDLYLDIAENQNLFPLSKDKLERNQDNTAFIICHNKYFQNSRIVGLIYNYYINILILGFLFLYGVFRRKLFFVEFSVAVLSIAFLTTVFMHYRLTLYLFAIFLVTRAFFIIAISTILAEFISNLKKKSS